jgi:hypothetical protein
MEKLFIAFTIFILFGFNFSQNCIAQPEAMPPLLTQQAPAPAPAPAAPGPPAIPPADPGVQPGPPATPPLPGHGIIVVQTIAPQTLRANLPKAIATARKLGKQLEPGKVWMMRGPAGELEIKAGILYQGIAVAVLHFDPLSGDVLPLGINTHTYQSNIQIQQIKTRLPNVIKNLQIIPAAEFREPEASWSFPIIIDDRIVAHLNVYYDGIHILQNYPANQEMIFYGQ